jgi:hypothetical protein
MQSSLVTKLKGIDHSSTIIDGLKATAVSSATGQTINFDAAHTEIHLRQNGADLDGAISLTDAQTVIKDWPQVFPKLSSSADITLAGKAGMIDGSDRTRPLRCQRRTAQGGCRYRRRQGDDAERPVLLRQEGYLTGQFKLQIEDLSAWRDSIKQTFPGIAKTVDTASKLLKALAGGSNKVSVDLVVQRGNATVSGFIPLGQIPPI